MSVCNLVSVVWLGKLCACVCAHGPLQTPYNRETRLASEKLEDRHYVSPAFPALQAPSPSWPLPFSSSPHVLPGEPA